MPEWPIRTATVFHFYAHISCYFKTRSRHDVLQRDDLCFATNGLARQVRKLGMEANYAAVFVKSILTTSTFRWASVTIISRVKWCNRVKMQFLPAWCHHSPPHQRREWTHGGAGAGKLSESIYPWVPFLIIFLHCFSIWGLKSYSLTISLTILSAERRSDLTRLQDKWAAAATRQAD